MLNELGYSPGLADGLLGPQTSLAVQRFQRDVGLPVTGIVDAAILDALRDSAASNEVQAGAPERPEERPIPQLDAVDQPAESTRQSTPDLTGLTDAPPIRTATPVQMPSALERQAEDSLFPTLVAAFGIGGVIAFLVWHRRKARKSSPWRTSSGRTERSAPPVERRTSQGQIWPTPAAKPAGPPVIPLVPEKAITARPRAPVPPAAPPPPAAAARTLETLDPDDVVDLKISVQVTGGRPPPLPIPPRPHKPTDGCWVPAEGRAEVAGHRIGGMVYVGTSLYGLTRDGFARTPENCLINPMLPVAKTQPDRTGASMPYWPSYSSIEPPARLAYLQWLAGGRQGADIGIGYVFLFFYGLERRVLVDGCGAGELARIADEVRRLRRAYGENRSFERYSAELLDAIAVLGDQSDLGRLSYGGPARDLPLATRVALGRKIKEGQPLDADSMLAWWWHHPETRLRTPAVRAFSEFRQLFLLRFAERYPNGLKVRGPKQRLKYIYRAASGSFEVDLTERLGNIPDIAAVSAPVGAVTAIAEPCMEDLAGFSRFLGRKPDGRGKLEAYALLPPELASRLPNQELDALKGWAEDKIRSSSGLVPVLDVLGRLEGQPPDKVTRKALTTAADALACQGVGLAPDPRFALRTPKAGEAAILFRLPQGITTVDQASPGYSGALISVMLGAYVAHADGEVADEERRDLESWIDRVDGLPPAEVARLRANLSWALAVPPSFTDLRKHFKDLPEDARQTLAKLAVAIAASDGRIDPGEVNALTKLYRTLDLEESAVFADLHAAVGQAPPAPVTRQPARLGNDRPAAPRRPAAQDGTVSLDADQVARIRRDTEKVSRILHEVFRQEEPDNEPPIEEEPALSQYQQAFAGLDAEHRPLADELASRTTWTQAEFAKLAARYGLMPGGALETLNEWAFGRWDEPLLEEDGDLTMNPIVLQELTSSLGQGEHHGTA